MALEWYGGVPWVPRALSAAKHRGIALDAATLAREYRAGDGGFARVPETDRHGRVMPDRVRISRDGLSVIVAVPSGVVLGYGIGGS